MTSRRETRNPGRLRVLLIADSHLGFDHPVRPRIKRRRRGLDFLRNYQRACRTAIDEQVDLLVHGGDMFHAPTAPSSLVYQAFDPLKLVADAGIPVCVVPGNHERSKIPFDWLGRHPSVQVFQEPATARLVIKGVPVGVSGIPCVRGNARERFKAAVSRTRWRDVDARLRLLITHQAFEGAVVGPSDFMFRDSPDVVRLADVPRGFAAVLSGHIHRSQVLRSDLQGRPAPAPVFYPGSLERTAFAERHEEKGFHILDVQPDDQGGRVPDWEFRDIGARPMQIAPLRVIGSSAAQLERDLRAAVASAPVNAVLRLEADGPPEPDARHRLGAEGLRSLAPDTMNLDVVIPGVRRWEPRGQQRSDREPADPTRAVQGTLF